MAELSEESTTNIEKRLNKVIHNLEEKTKHLVGQVRDEMLPQAEATVKENIWITILSALGIGLILGLILGLTSGRR